MSPDVYLVTAHLGLGDETWSALAPSHDEVFGTAIVSATTGRVSR